jgi:hypothetical protein
MRQKTLVVCLVSTLCFPACTRKAKKDAPAAVSASAVAVKSAGPPPGRNWPLQSGPMLAIFAGQGVGPIRLGATVPTIQRHMALPCEVKTPTHCRYIARGVEFELENGATKRVLVHRAGRAAGKDTTGVEREYGFFNGAVPPDVRLGMTPQAVQEHLGPPERVEKIAPLAPNNTAERHHYPGLVAEYDRHTNGNLILGGVVIEKKSSEALAPSASASAASRK